MEEEPDAVAKEEVGPCSENDHVKQGLKVLLVELALEVKAT